MNGFWIMIGILVLAAGFADRMDCALKVPGACEALAVKRLNAEKAQPSKKD